MSDLEVIKEIEQRIGKKLEKVKLDSVISSMGSYTLNQQQQLIGLNLDRCQLNNISFLGTCIHLQKLSLDSNQLTDISSLQTLTNLTWLNLTENRLTDISSLQTLTNLIVLDLSLNQLTDISSLQALTNLTWLYLTSNRLTDISSLQTLINLTWLDLRYNSLRKLPEWILVFNLEMKWIDGGIRGIYLQGNPFEFPPPEIIKQGNTAIRAYFESLKEKQRPLNELKVLFVGDGGAGKTSLSKVLRNESFNIQENQTHGINIIHWQCHDLTLHFWDFGGQEVMHATHQFFLSKRSLYILVLDGRKEEDPEYWLKHIQSFGGESPVLIVLNKTDEHPSFDVNRQHLLNKYPNIQGFYKLSCKNKQGLNEFQTGFYNAFDKVEILKTTWGESWFQVKTELEQLTQHYINSDHYHEICSQHRIKETKTHEILAKYLHDLGIIVHFSDFELNDTHILEPRWITEAVYKIINSQQLAEKQGLLCLSVLDNILKKQQDRDYNYPKEKHRHIIKLMEKFELCYKVDKEHILIPDLLSIQQPDFELTDKKLLRFRLKYDFLPKSIMPRFIVKRHPEIHNDLRWRTGVVLYDKVTKAMALIRSDDHDKIIDIQVNGDQKRDFFAVIRKTFHDIHETFEKLNITELIPLPDYPNICLEYQELIGYELDYEDNYRVGKLRKVYSVSMLLNGIEKPEYRKILSDLHYHTHHHKEENVTTITHISHSEIHGSVLAAETITNCLNTMQTSQAESGVKELLTSLLKEIEKLNKSKLSAKKVEIVEEMSREAKDLVEEVNSKQPRKRNAAFSLDGIKEAAIKLGETAKPIIELAEKISPFLQTFI
jgi:small GTP-binding protein